MQTDTYWYKKNELGDIAEIYGVNGKICEYRYDAWGNYRLIDSGTGMDVTKDQVIGGISTNVSAHIGHINPFRYRGYYYDEETGFYYLNTRYYDPEIRRFINMDNPELVAQLAQTPGQLNLYAYCNNNPVAFTDENGEGFIFSLFIIGFIIGAATGAIDAYYREDNILAGAIIGGLVGGIISGCEFGFAASAAISGIGAAIIDLSNGRDISWKNIVIAAGVGGLFGGITNGIGRAFDSAEKIVKIANIAVLGANLGFLQLAVNMIVNPKPPKVNHQNSVEKMYIVGV